MSWLLRRPAVIAHAFFAADRVHAGTIAGQRLTELWRSIEGQGINESYKDAWPIRPETFAACGYVERLTVLAAAKRSVEDEIHEAIAYQLHDVIGVAVVQARGNGPTDWDDLRTSWFDEWQLEDEAGVLGTATNHLAVLDRVPRWGHSAEPETIGRQIEESVRQIALKDTDWTGCWSRPVPELLIWELPANAPLSRRLLVVADQADEPTMNDWFWGSATTELPSFTAYLLHAAKLRYEQSRLSKALPEISATIKQAGERCNELARQLNSDSLSVDQLLEADRALADLQGNEKGLIATLADVQTMAVTVQIAQANMRAKVGRSRTGAGGGPLDNDRQIARWTRDQLEAERMYLSAARQRAAELGRVFEGVVRQGLQQRRDNLSLTQTAIIGSLLTVLAAVQSLQYHVPLPTPLLAPTIVVLGAIALLLPSAVLGRIRGPAEYRTWARLDAFLAALFGGAVGWLIATIAFERARGHGAPTVWSIGAAGVGGIVAVLLSWRRSHR